MDAVQLFPPPSRYLRSVFVLRWKKEERVTDQPFCVARIHLSSVTLGDKNFIPICICDDMDCNGDTCPQETSVWTKSLKMRAESVGSASDFHHSVLKNLLCKKNKKKKQ